MVGSGIATGALAVGNTATFGQNKAIKRGMKRCAKDTAAAAVKCEFRDVSNLNPVRLGSTIVKDIVSVTADIEIFIGKRPLKAENNPFGLTISPGVDLCHWALLIKIGKDHKTYQLTKGAGGKTVMIYGWDDTFSWYPTKGTVVKSHAEIMDYCERDMHTDYNLLAVFEKGNNCQTYCAHVHAFACQTKLNTAEGRILVGVGTIFC